MKSRHVPDPETPEWSHFVRDELVLVPPPTDEDIENRQKEVTAKLRLSLPSCVLYYTDFNNTNTNDSNNSWYVQIC